MVADTLVMFSFSRCAADDDAWPSWVKAYWTAWLYGSIVIAIGCIIVACGTAALTLPFLALFALKTLYVVSRLGWIGVLLVVLVCYWVGSDDR